MTLWWLKFQRDLGVLWKEALLLAVGHFVVGVIVMKLWAILEAGGNLEKAANMRMYGAMFLMPPMYYLWAKLTKRNISLAMDAATICLQIGLIVGRINCLLGGCCEGTRIIFGSSVRWPIREIELAYCVIFCVIYCIRILKKKTHGEVLSAMMVSYGALRFILEWIREEYTGNIGVFHLAHIWSLITIVIGAGIYYILAKKQGSGNQSRKNLKYPSKKKEEKAK